ncbi:MAG: hypothetical protein LBT46_11160 [Planctomycetaceae bacterium]|jgi:hypothetical protein|nr:hypothetical protein [Planctomycetaceae bacterium]
MQYIEERIGKFHNTREEKLNGLDLRDMLKHKNPYLFKAKNILTAQDLIKGFLDTYLHTQEETFFGNFLQDIAIFVCGQVYNGERIDKSLNSELKKFDLGFQKEQTYYLVEIKSGWNWGNSGQIRDLTLKTQSAINQLKTYKNCEVVIVNGCCFGKRKVNEMTGGYLKICGQQFWKFISDDEGLYIDIIEPVGHRAKERSMSYQKIYAQVVNKFTLAFSQEFCDDGIINWERLTRFVSEKYPEKGNTIHRS